MRVIIAVYACMHVVTLDTMTHYLGIADVFVTALLASRVTDPCPGRTLSSASIARSTCKVAEPNVADEEELMNNA